jgi:hypothetical protein
MTAPRRWSFKLRALLVVATLLVMVTLLSAAYGLLVLSRWGHETRPPQSSPDGSAVLNTWIQQRAAGVPVGRENCVVIQVIDRNGRVVLEENTGASCYMRWSVGWESNQQIRLDSSDIGSYSWRLEPDGKWAKAIDP